uniref:TERF1-interacting nuclear factor 2 N-terminal domain-containing protein n=1 Tax=Accipiter nisus TaxID=211598 RepID=A0A8B9MME6_9AVES
GSACRGAGPGVSLRVALAGAWHVVRGRSLVQFPRVLGLLEAVGRAAPAAVRFRHGVRLRLGLQAAVSTGRHPAPARPPPRPPPVHTS